ncbi:hypothetical protein ACTM8Z_01305 [Atopobiaceae bacterium HCP3S3_D6]
MAAQKGQTYDFVFVHEDGAQLERVRSGHSQGKTLLRISQD